MKIDIRNKEWLITFCFWIVVFLTQLVQVIPQTYSLIEAITYCILFILTIYPSSTYLSGKVLIKAIQEKASKRFTLYFIANTLIVSILFGANIYLFTYLEQTGVFPESRYFSLDYVTPYMAIIAPLAAGTIINISICGIRFLLEYINSQNRLAEYQLKMLQHQFTPHFMFNVLNHIHILMQTDVNLASDLLIRYSNVLRYQLYNGDKEITIAKEIQFLKDYIEVEKTRWQGKLDVNVSWKIENEQQNIPSLLFITFFENAFKHVNKEESNRGNISITFIQTPLDITLVIENSIQEKNSQPLKKEDSGVGLKNIQERLNLLYFNKHSLDFKRVNNLFTVKLIIEL